LGAVHGIAGPLGGMFPISHGVICGRLLPFVMEANVKAIQERMSNATILKRFDEIAQIVTGNALAKAKNGLEWIRELCSDLNIPKLSQFGLEENHLISVIERARQASSMKGNPINLMDEELINCLRRAL
jgi:alcohol dehydrogenase class IV